MLAVALKDTQSEAIIGTTKKTRCQPLTSSAKTFLINIAYSPIRGVNNLKNIQNWYYDNTQKYTGYGNAVARPTAWLLLPFQWKSFWRFNNV